MPTRVLHRTRSGRAGVVERAHPWAATLLLSGTLLQGCAGTRAGDDPADERARRAEIRGTVVKPLPERVPAPPEPVTGEAPAELVARIREDVIRGSGADPSTVKLIRDESVTWSDGSLGCPRPGEAYTQATVSGFWIVFDVAGRPFDYRVDGHGNYRLCEGRGAFPPATP